MSKTDRMFEPRFEDFWESYDKKCSKPLCHKKWKKLAPEEKWKAIKHVPMYVRSTPDKQFRKNPLTYINQKCWDDEIINNGKANRSAEYLQGIAHNTSI